MTQCETLKKGEELAAKKGIVDEFKVRVQACCNDYCDGVNCVVAGISEVDNDPEDIRQEITLKELEMKKQGQKRIERFGEIVHKSELKVWRNKLVTAETA